MTALAILANGKQWREGKVRPVLGNSPHDRLGKPGVFFHVKGEFATIPSAPLLPVASQSHTRAPQYAFFKAWRNLSGPMGFKTQNQTSAREHTASRRSAPSQGQRTCREDHALSHRPQMSSGRLFLDRVARQQSPSLLHRHEQNNMHSSRHQAKGDISTLQRRGHFYFALTNCSPALTLAFSGSKLTGG